jgi:hypothetical protein
MDDREVIAAMGEMIDAATQHGEVVARMVADDLIGKLRLADPEFLARWLDIRAGETLGAYVRERLNSQRSYARSMHRRSVFAHAAVEFELTGESSAFALFDSLVVVGPDNLRKRFGDLTRDDCLFVAAKYGASRREAEAYERFHQKLAERLGDKTVREVYSEAQCIAMLGSFRNH